MSTDARAARLGRPWGCVPTLALVGDVDPAPARAGGWEVRGRLGASPFSGGPREDVAGYLDLGELLADARIDAAVVDGAGPGLAGLLPAAARGRPAPAAAHPAPLDVEALRAARAVDGPEAVVGLVQRWEPWARTVAAALPLAGGPPLQMTVRGWPPGPASAPSWPTWSHAGAARWPPSSPPPARCRPRAAGRGARSTGRCSPTAAPRCW
jgi:predicted dehydrogenase